jgi:hypothetical protein
MNLAQQRWFAEQRRVFDRIGRRQAKAISGGASVRRIMKPPTRC